jgi:hypothetical protein
MVKSISYKQEEIIKSILKLNVKDETFDLDPTYSKGIFYKTGEIKEPKLKFDKNPQTEDTSKASFEKLPILDKTVNSIMFDPPFIINGSGVIKNRFGCYKNIRELKKSYKKALIEFNRILKKKGVIAFKCMDTVVGNSNQFILNHIINISRQLGYRPKDQYILLNDNKIYCNKWKNQHHARKCHSYFLVLEKVKDYQPEKIDRSAIFRRGWQLAKEKQNQFGRSAKDYISASLKQAWQEYKMTQNEELLKQIA